LDKYLKDYFENFSLDNLSINIMRGEISLSDLIFSPKIMESASIPVRLKFGMLGKLEI